MYMHTMHTDPTCGRIHVQITLRWYTYTISYIHKYMHTYIHTHKNKKCKYITRNNTLSSRNEHMRIRMHTHTCRLYIQIIRTDHTHIQTYMYICHVCGWNKRGKYTHQTWQLSYLLTYGKCIRHQNNEHQYYIEYLHFTHTHTHMHTYRRCLETGLFGTEQQAAIWTDRNGVIVFDEAPTG